MSVGFRVDAARPYRRSMLPSASFPVIVRGGYHPPAPVNIVLFLREDQLGVFPAFDPFTCLYGILWALAVDFGFSFPPLQPPALCLSASPLFIRRNREDGISGWKDLRRLFSSAFYACIIGYIQSQGRIISAPVCYSPPSGSTFSSSVFCPFIRRISP